MKHGMNKGPKIPWSHARRVNTGFSPEPGINRFKLPYLHVCNRGEWVVYAYAVKLSAYSYCFVMPVVRLQDRTNLNDLHFVVVVVVVVIIIIVMFCYQK